MAEIPSNYSAIPDGGVYSALPDLTDVDTAGYSVANDLYGSEGIYGIDSYTQIEPTEPDSAYSAYAQLPEDDEDDVLDSGYGYSRVDEETGSYTDNSAQTPTKDLPKAESQSRRLPQNAWSERFNRVSAMKESEVKNEELFKLANDFAFIAECYGKIIISEKALPVDMKTIKPVNAGGIAGGEKFIVSGILFKFAAGENSIMIYGNEENAQKVASHELRGLNEFYLAGVDGLHFPLMALVNYLGFCLIAISLLPIGKESLVYGSNDGGKTIHFDDPILYEKMREVGQKLNTKPHIAGAPGAASQEIWGPGDIEGHRGTDSRYYVLDYARTFPPEHPGPAQKPEKGSVFFRLLRPELVRTFQCPLSPDALVGWGKADPNQPIHNKEVLDATLFLRDVVIPPIARELDGETERLGRLELEVVEKFTHTLGSRLHTNGINLRYLGLIRQHAANKSFHAISLTEMIARVFKSRLNEKLRSAIASDSGIAIEKCLRYAVESINLIISQNSTDPKVTKFWHSKIKYFLLSKFEKGLLPDELDADYDLRQSLVDASFLRFRKVIMNRFCTLCGISLSDDAAHYLSSLRDDNEPTVLVPGDVVGFRPKIKNMVLGDFSYASSKFLAGLHVLQSNANVVVADRLFAMASAALKQSPRCAGIFFSRILDSESVKRQLEDLSSRDIRSKFLGEVLQVAAMLSLTVKQGLSPEESKLAQVDDLAAAAKLLRKRNYVQPAKAIISRAASMGVSTASFIIEHFRLTNNFTYGDGLGLLQEALKLDPENIRARYYILLSHCYVPSRDYPQFIGDLAEVIKKRPEWLCRKHLLNTISSLPSRLTQFLALGEPDRWKHLANGEELNHLFIQCAAAALGKLTSMSFTPYCPPSVLSRYVEHLSDGNMNLESLLFDECGLDAPLLQSILLKVCQRCSTLRFVHSPTVWVSFEHLKTMTNLKHLYLIGATLEPKLSLLDLASLSPSVEGLFLDGLRSDWQPDDICQLVKSLPNLRGLGLPLWTDDAENTEEHAQLRSSLFASIQSSKEHFANITYLSIRSYKSVWPEVASSLQSLVSDLPALQILDLRNSSIGAYHKSIVGLVHPNLVAVIDRDANCLVYTGNRNSEFVIERQSSMVGGRSGSYIWKATLFETESERLLSALEKCGQGDIPLWNFRNRRSFDLVTSPLSFKDKVFLQDYSQFYMLNVDKTEKKPTVSAAGNIDLHWIRSEPIFSLAPGAGASGGRFTIGNATVVLSASISRVEVVLANKTLGVLQSHATSVLFRGSLGPNICLTAYALAIIAYLNRVRG